MQLDLSKGVRKGLTLFGAVVVTLSVIGAFVYWGPDFGKGPGVPRQSVDANGTVTTRH